MRKSILFIFLLLFIISSEAQTKWHPYAGIHLSGNADMYYIGPSFSAGTYHFIGKKKEWAFSPELQYFRKKIKTGLDASTYEKSQFLSWSFRANFSYFGKGEQSKGFFAGAGIGFQFANDECYTYINGEPDKSPGEHFYELKYGSLMMTINFGYSFKLKKEKVFQLLITGIGPYVENDRYESYIEILSVLNIGSRIVF